MREIPVYHGRKVVAYTKVDDDDFEQLSQRRWYLKTTGYAHNNDRKTMHRVVLGLKRGDGKIVDHINHDRLDNRRSNMRLVTRRVNQQNRLANRSSTSAF